MSEEGSRSYRFGLASVTEGEDGDGTATGYERWFEQRQFAALARPSDSTLQITIDPSDLASIAQLQIISFREELMHGRRQRFGPMRNIRLLKREAGRVVYDALRDRHDPDNALTTARSYYETVESLLEQIRFPLEQVDKFLAYSLLEDEAHVKDEIDVLVANSDAPVSTRRTIEQAIESFDLDAHTPGSDDHIYRELVSLEAEYNRLAAEAVANAALDIPYLVTPLSLEAFDSRPVEAIDIEARFDRARRALSEMDSEGRLSDPTSATRKRLFDEVKSTMRAPSAHVLAQSLREIGLPLLDVPLQATMSDAEQQSSWAVWNEHSDPLSRLVHGGFSFPGGFGGAVYRLPDGGRRWLVNPAVRNHKLEWRDDTWRYHRFWQHAFVLDGLIRQLLTTPMRIQCPLCRHTTDGRCGVNGCGASDYVHEARLLGARHGC